MKQQYSKREKELMSLSELIGQSHTRITNELLVLEKLMWLLIYNAGENYSEELKTQFKKPKKCKER
jgi:hypothetical protein